MSFFLQGFSMHMARHMVQDTVVLGEHASRRPSRSHGTSANEAASRNGGDVLTVLDELVGGGLRPRSELSHEPRRSLGDVTLRTPSSPMLCPIFSRTHVAPVFYQRGRRRTSRAAGGTRRGGALR